MEVDHATYSKATRPAIQQPPLTVEDEAQGLVRRIRATSGGERQHNLATLGGELRTLERNQANGYGGWEFRINVLRRALELVGSF